MGYFGIRKKKKMSVFYVSCFQMIGCWKFFIINVWLFSSITGICSKTRTLVTLSCELIKCNQVFFIIFCSLSIHNVLKVILILLRRITSFSDRHHLRKKPTWVDTGQSLQYRRKWGRSKDQSTSCYTSVEEVWKWPSDTTSWKYSGPQEASRLALNHPLSL